MPDLVNFQSYFTEMGQTKAFSILHTQHKPFNLKNVSEDVRYTEELILDFSIYIFSN